MEFNLPENYDGGHPNAQENRSFMLKRAFELIAEAGSLFKALGLDTLVVTADLAIGAVKTKYQWSSCIEMHMLGQEIIGSRNGDTNPKVVTAHLKYMGLIPLFPAIGMSREQVLKSYLKNCYSMYVKVDSRLNPISIKTDQRISYIENEIVTLYKNGYHISRGTLKYLASEYSIREAKDLPSWGTDVPPESKSLMPFFFEWRHDKLRKEWVRKLLTGKCRQVKRSLDSEELPRGVRGRFAKAGEGIVSDSNAAHRMIADVPKYAAGPSAASVFANSASVDAEL